MAGTISRGIKAPIIREGDDIVKIVADSVIEAAEKDGFQLHDRDVVAVTEAVVARGDGNYCSVDDSSADVQEKLGDTIGVVFPIMSRNRFAICLRGIARGAKKVIVQLSYPADEEGNHLIDEDALFDTGVNPYTDVFTESEFIAKFGEPVHPFTGVNYLAYYRSLIEEEGAEAVILLANDPTAVLQYTDCVLVSNIHERERTARRLQKAGAARVLTLCGIMNESRNGSGFQPDYGLLGSNKATENVVKLFPKNAYEVANAIQKEIVDRTGVHVEAMVYGDGAFKDPVGKIWELADPVVSPGYTEGLI